MKELGFLTVCYLLFMPVAMQADMIDLTTSGSSGTSNGALFLEAGIAPTGSGNIDSFVRVSSNDPVEDGYNTSGRPLLYDENSSPTFTHDLLLASIPIVDIDGTNYREFILDINQKNSGTDAFLSLDVLNIYTSASAYTNPLPTIAGLGTPIYTLEEGNWLKFDFNLNAGSGKGDMYAYIPDSLFAGTYVTLYSQFGNNFPNNDGFEEWAVRTAVIPPPPPPPVPEPATALLLGLGLVGLAALRKKF